MPNSKVKVSKKMGVTNPWIAIDLDGTLAYLGKWRGPKYIGRPIKKMVRRVKRWLAMGLEVRIFTARAELPDLIPYIEKWCLKHLGVVLKVTNIKDLNCIAIWDDRAVRVGFNKGDPTLRMCSCGHRSFGECWICGDEVR